LNYGTTFSKMPKHIKVASYKQGKANYLRYTKEKKQFRHATKRPDDQTEIICSHVEILVNSNYKKEDPRLSNIHPRAYEILFGKKEAPVQKQIETKDISSSSLVDLSKANKPSIAFFEVVKLLEAEREKTKELTTDRDHWRALYTAMSKTREGKILEAERNIPSTNEVLELYWHNVKNLYNAKSHILIMQELITDADCWDKKISSIDEVDIYKFLTKDQTKKNFKSSNERWDKQRQFFNRFWNWAKQLYHIEQVVEFVEMRNKRKAGSKKKKVLVNFHKIKEVEAVIESTDLYYGTIIAVMAYAGLSQHEVRNLTVRDVIDSTNKAFKGRKCLRVILHEDINPDGSMKANARVRAVLIHEKLLLPRLKEYLNQGLQGENFLFPALWRTAGKEQWSKESLSGRLNGKKNKKGGWDAEPIFPKEMNCLSLRRTFGSLQRRSGLTSEQVANQMGNSEEMVDTHYATLDLKGDEFDVSFSPDDSTYSN